MKLNSRYVGAVMIAPFIVFILLGGVWLKGFTMVLSVCGLYEFYKALKEKEFNPLPIIGYILLAIFYLLGNDFDYLIYIAVLATMILLVIPVINLKYTFIDASITLLGFLYVGILFSFIPLVNSKIYGNFLVWLIFIGSWGADTLAYYSGKYLGKKKLCPEVSPKKTIAGAVGGLLGSTIGCGIFGIIIASYVPGIQIIHFFLIGALCGIMGQFGDLVASSIKRYVGIKDYSNLIPGHGGILDRFDSILFNSAVVFYYLTFVIGI
ncbi:phosphatidate cytidylyltransferase [Clostridium sp. AL.422]|uniref:phosphatidate cytidylyltransferase n=1 Tax=Clostridium TaxID=1485 RepID=UPI00293DD04C|nr:MULTISPECIES: phosphatidate cytidylyltransferase [unclassified Clostridium]MDV4151174.1 phosphatidate cytidylyltransferase [Clostridium sp. AL.422]